MPAIRDHSAIAGRTGPGSHRFDSTVIGVTIIEPGGARPGSEGKNMVLKPGAPGP